MLAGMAIEVVFHFIEPFTHAEIGTNINLLNQWKIY